MRLKASDTNELRTKKCFFAGSKHQQSPWRTEIGQFISAWDKKCFKIL